ncbi:Phenylacetaldehyde reductase [Linum grandiflorum]
MSGAGEGRTVCVTGGSGYIASWIIKLLLERGYTVKTTVRDPTDKTKTQHLLSLDGAGDRLQLYKADLTEDGCFDAAVSGCDGVFHTASPCFFQTTNPQEDLIEPAVKGTLSVLKSCAKVPSVKRVVLTASMASVICNGRPLSPDVVVDETWFSDPEFCQKNQHWYMLSKTLAEEAAWTFAKENGIDLITINPGFVIGPYLQKCLNFTVEEVLRIINERYSEIKFAFFVNIRLLLFGQFGQVLLLNAGTREFPGETYRFVDVRDVANAHVLAFENPSASGRYCVVGRMAHYTKVLEIMHEQYPDLQIAEKCESDKTSQPTCKISQEKAKSLGLNFTPLEVSVRDTIECFKKKGVLRF